MSAALKVYRVYSYDVGRKTVTAEFIKAADDAAAIAAAQAADFAGNASCGTAAGWSRRSTANAARRNSA